MTRRSEPSTVDLKRAEDLPHDRCGFIMGVHAMREYRFPPLYVYRITVSGNPAGSSAPLFYIDAEIDGKGYAPIARQLSFPSLEDCLTARRGRRT